ncbi:hypothetical protein RJT34_19238 [Clitoria ternatea]|uniref:Uncharacterized protein n=1 Tax=Clitoria ternatea TaxID=43366 RepID=A0AAN9P3E9_CLITE
MGSVTRNKRIIAGIANMPGEFLCSKCQEKKQGSCSSLEGSALSMGIHWSLMLESKFDHTHAAFLITHSRLSRLFGGKRKD